MTAMLPSPPPQANIMPGSLATTAAPGSERIRSGSSSKPSGLASLAGVRVGTCSVPKTRYRKYGGVIPGFLLLRQRKTLTKLY